MNSKLVLFGTGHDLPLYEGLLDLLNIDVYCYADNDKSKWDTYRNGKKIIQPSLLKNLNNKILISCSFICEIKNQLEQMGIGSRIITTEDIVKYSINNKLSYFEYLRNKKIKLNKNKKIIFDVLFGNGWGGIETWSFTVAEELINRKHNVKIIALSDLKNQPKKVENVISRYNINNKNFSKSVMTLINNLCNDMPFTFINNMTGIGFLVCYILKLYFPDNIKIISVLHGNDDSICTKYSLWQGAFEKILCVSPTTLDRAYKQLGITKEKLIYKANPIDFDIRFKKSYSLKHEPIKIGYAARLEVLDKRADLIIPFIKKLAEQHVNFILDIAGDGSCLNPINDFVFANHLEANVHVLGYVEHSNMPKFWKAQDVCVNLSEREGCCLSMLEAMSYGVVPVVTNVGEASNFIVNKENGFISTVGNLNDIVANIKCLSENKNLLSKFGDICRNNIYTRCNKKDYIDTIKNLCDV